MSMRVDRDGEAGCRCDDVEGDTKRQRVVYKKEDMGNAMDGDCRVYVELSKIGADRDF